MTSRDRVIHTLLHQPVDRAARDLRIAPSIEAAMADEVADLLHRYPNDVAHTDPRWSPGGAMCERHGSGESTDAWGCTWRSDGLDGRPTLAASPLAASPLAASPLADAARIDAFKPPWDSLATLDAAAVNRFCRGTTRFVAAHSTVAPLHRLQSLCGPEAALAELKRGSRRIRTLLDSLHDYFRREIEAWAATEVDAVVIRDPWGDDHGPIAPAEVWRELFRPLYGDYCEIVHAHDKFVLLDVGGDVAESFGEWVDLGIDALHCAFFGSNLPSLSARHRDRVTFWAGIDRPGLLASATPEEIRAAVFRVRAALDFGRGGVIARCEWNSAVHYRQVVAAMEAWLAPLPMNAGVDPPARAG